jgi:transketolase
MKPKHDSIRGWFAAALYEEMAKDDRIWLLTGDLGYGMLDDIRDDFPDRFLNCGASEQAAIGIACGLALSGKIPFVYSITPFLIYRPFEWLRNYVNHEKIPVRLIGSGLNDDYKHDGITHHCHDLHTVMTCFPNIVNWVAYSKEVVPAAVKEMILHNGPSFMGLSR